MKRIHLVLTIVVLGLLASSCGAIPTLPPLESTVTIKTPRFTDAPEHSAATGQVEHQELTATPVESPSVPPVGVNILPQPTDRVISATETAASVVPETPLPTGTSAATAAPEATFTSTPFPYKLQVLNPHYLANFTHPELGCDWLGIGGQIFNREGVVQKDIIIKVEGELLGSPAIEGMTMPLAEPDIDIFYGPGGYELTLADSPAESDSTLWVQLFSLDGTPLSEEIYLVTYDDCNRNLLLLNFIEE